MSFHLRSLVGVSLLAAACSAEPSSGTDSPTTGGAGSPASSAGASSVGGTQAGQTGQAGQTPGSGGSAGSTSGSSGSSSVSGSAGSGGSAGTGGGSAGSSGSGPHAGDGCVPGGTGFDTSFTDVVLDRATCLVRERKDPPRDMAACELKRADVPSSLCFPAAQAYCEALMLDGKGDWRLPTVSELQTLVVSPPPKGPIVPTIDHDAFPDAIANLYWSSETAGAKVHCVDFNGGPPTSNTGPDGPQALRCVRGAAQ